MRCVGDCHLAPVLGKVPKCSNTGSSYVWLNFVFSSILLLNLPADEVQIDLAYFPIEHSNTALTMVPPGSWHYVGVKDRENYQGVWCWLQVDEILVKTFDPDRGLINPIAEIADQAIEQFNQGQFSPTNQDYPHQLFGAWYGLVMHLPAESFPPTLHQQDSTIEPSRFVNALLGTHHGQTDRFLAEFQYAFVSWLVSTDQAQEERAAFDRWQHLLLAIYNAGEFQMRNYADFFGQLVDVLMRQFACLDDSCFEPKSGLIYQIDYFLEDLIDAEIPLLAEKSEQLQNYLANRSES